MGKTGSSADLYDVLGVAKDASAQDIKKAFRVLARECHPDVAGNDPKMAEKFVKAREAYELLSDPAQRARYDRRGERRTSPFYGNMWNRGASNVGAPPPTSSRGRAAKDLDLEDIFNDFGVGDFGFTGSTRGQPGPVHQGTASQPGGRVKSAPPPPPPPKRPGQVPGRDIPLRVDLSPDVALRGGTVTVTYTRLRRADDGHTLYHYEELHDLKVPPGMRHGDTLRVTGMGDAGLEGGRYGELVVDLRVLARPATSAGAPSPMHTSTVGVAAEAPRARPASGRVKTEPRGGAWDPEDEVEESGVADDEPGGRSAPRAEPGAGTASSGAPGSPRDPGRMKMPSREDGVSDGVVRVDVGVVEALLGGRVLVETAGGAVRVNIPAGTSSGTRMRLRGRGPLGADGLATDLVAEVRIVVPKGLDDESRRLIERFGELNRR